VPAAKLVGCAHERQALSVAARRRQLPGVLSCVMGDDTTDRAALRSRTWTGGISRPRDADPDAAFWHSATTADKLDTLRTLADDAAAMVGNGTPARLQRHLGGVRRPQR
jgi:hypothetical protein